jgi:hypothetical protein
MCRGPHVEVGCCFCSSRWRMMMGMCSLGMVMLVPMEARVAGLWGCICSPDMLWVHTQYFVNSHRTCCNVNIFCLPQVCVSPRFSMLHRWCRQWFKSFQNLKIIFMSFKKIWNFFPYVTMIYPTNLQNINFKYFVFLSIRKWRMCGSQYVHFFKFSVFIAFWHFCVANITRNFTLKIWCL